jgi:hypothetical protein
VTRRCLLPSGKSVDLDDIPIVTLERLAIESGLERSDWWRVVEQTILYPSAAVALLDECATMVGDDLPGPQYLTHRNLMTTFVSEPGDSRPTEYEDGIPKEADGEEMTS